VLSPPDPSRPRSSGGRSRRKTPAGVWVIVSLAVFFVIAGLGISAFIIFKALHERSAQPSGAMQQTIKALPSGSPGQAGVEQPVPDAVSQSAGEQLSAIPVLANSDEQDETRREVLKRIDVMKSLSDRDKDQLYAQVEKARGFIKLAIIPFSQGKIVPGVNEAQNLIKQLQQPDVQGILKDPTTVIVVLGFADARGDEEKNLEISRSRAASVIKELKEKTTLVNVMHPVAMGGQNLFDTTKTERNRLVEVWIAQP
jgi:outer membrane protein OmpA-like peptidoglycan-associated protein